MRAFAPLSRRIANPRPSGRHAWRCVPIWIVALITLGACADDGELPTEQRAEEPAIPVPPTLNPRTGMEVEGYPTTGEMRRGFIVDRYGQPMEITYEIHNGMAIWQGDIIIGTPDQVATSAAGLAIATGGLQSQGVVVDDNGNNRWPNGVVPYRITTASMSDVLAAIDRIEDQTPGVTLIPWTTEANYVTFQDDSGCSSRVGMFGGGEQFINLSVANCSVGNGAHEILHALGMYHEHSRCDRDNFVTIDFAEIDPAKVENFYKAGASTQGGACTDATDIGAYDYGSMMHYGANTWAIGSNPTIIPTQPLNGAIMGQRSVVGPTDQQTIDRLYGANNAPPVAATSGPTGDFLEGSTLAFDASPSTDADDDDDILIFNWTFGDGTCEVAFPPLACSSKQPSHAYANDGFYAYGVTVSDGFDSTVDGASLNILNVVPVVAAGADVTLNEGDEYNRGGFFTDPGADPWTATVDYGDGGGPQLLTLSGKSFSLQHTYIDNVPSPVTVTVAVTDDDDTGTDDAQITINNVNPLVNAGPDIIVESGQTYDFSGSFSDPGIVDDPWSWLVEWGFGSDSSGNTDDQSARIELSRQVCVAGDYTVSLTVTDKDGGVGSDLLTLTVPYVAIGIDVLPGSTQNPVNLKAGGNLPVAILGSADLDVADINVASLTLGDGTGPDTPIAGKNNGTFAAYMEDVDRDGRMDLVTQFPIKDLVANGDLTDLSTELVLRGFLTNACTNFAGSNVVTVLR